MYFKMTKEKRGKYTVFENHRFYYSKTYSFGMVVPQNEVTDTNGATTGDVRKKQLVKTKQGWNRNDQGGPKMGPKGCRRERFRCLTPPSPVSKSPWGETRGGNTPLLKVKKGKRLKI